MNSFISPSKGVLEECPQPFVSQKKELSNVLDLPSNVNTFEKVAVLPTASNLPEKATKNIDSHMIRSGESLNFIENDRTSVDYKSSDEKINCLIGKWDLYYHLPYVKEWDISSYTVIMKNIDTVEKLVAINKYTPELIIKQCMLFVMRTGITPRWEDPKNKNGGCFSFKIVNKFVVSVWKLLFYSMCGETIFEKSNHNSLVNGITISPKKNFCIIKIWMENCSVQDPNLIVQIPNLIKQGCLFNKHDINK